MTIVCLSPMAIYKEQNRIEVIDWQIELAREDVVRNLLCVFREGNATRDP